MKKISAIALGLLLGAAAVAVSAHATPNRLSVVLSQNPIPVCPPRQPNCTLVKHKGK